VSFVQAIIKFFIVITGILLIGALPSLFMSAGNGRINFDISVYFSQVLAIIDALLHPNEIEYMLAFENYRKLFPYIFDPYLYSLSILFSALIFSLLAALLLTYITLFLPTRLVKALKGLTFVLESLPDIFVIFGLQLLVIWVYKKTNVLVFSFVSAGGDNIYLFPIFLLSILPTVHFYKIMLVVFEDESKKSYVDLAKSKGLVKSFIISVHIFRNALVTIFNHLKSIIWFMLSNLLILEYLINIPGLIGRFMFDYMSPVVFTIGLILLFVPIYTVLLFLQWIVQKISNEKVVV
jgi:peptide/nickel transport system permease protein